MKNKGHFGVLAIATAMLGAMLLSSCNHDEYYYSEKNVEQSINDKYAAAFEKAFGKVGPNVDWGFSNKNAGARAFTREGGVAFPTTITFPGDCDASNFLDAVPSGVTKLSPNGAGPGSWYIDAETQSVSTWSGASNIYVTGTVDLSDEDASANPWKFAPDINSKIYLVKGSKLILGPASALNFNVDAIYIAEGATLETAGLLKLNSGSKVYTQRAITTQDGGIIKVKDLEVNFTSILYNSGTVKATGTVSAESNSSDGVNDLSIIVNNGEIECEDVVVNAGAVRNFLNWNVKGTTYINSNNSGWINDGHWTTKDYAYVGGSKNVINNCSLTVTHDFDMNISSLSGVNEAEIGFKINSNGSVETQNFYGGRNLANNKVEGGPFKIRMAENSLFKVNNQATLESGRGPATDAEEGFGFFGPKSGGYAVFQAKNIVRDQTLANNNSHGAVTYSGNLYVSAETHFAQGYDSDGSGTYVPKPFIYERGSFSIANNIYAAGFNPGKPNYTIEESDCSPGFKGGNPLYRVIAEDLSAAEAGDFDFNDVVFDVVKAEGGKTTLKLICAGGVLPLKVGGVEVHGLFGETQANEQGQYKMYNTGAGPNVDPVTFDINGTYIEPADIKKIKIEVLKEGIWMELEANEGEAACKILVDSSFKPVTERQSIANDYGKFTNYVQGSFFDEFWWK